MEQEISAGVLPILMPQTERDEIAAALRKRSRPGEAVIGVMLRIAGAISVLTTAGIVAVLLYDAYLFFARPEPTLWNFFTDTTWAPQIDRFGIFPLVNATFLTSIIGMVVALPIGLMIAIYLSEYASPRARGILKPVLEILAGIPTVVFGFFALGFMTPLLQSIFSRDTVEIFNVASAGIVIGILIIP
ncbi:MAG TPA: phosphate ABC transporter permease subunit PstC, partial [Caldilinea sp.]|nr:phosphate ABC transporter permease subunit PstC [Caldilinea sp.]